jgi:hypothetical protein
LFSVCGLALFIFGCPKRQPTRVVYVPSQPPAASSADTAPSGVLVIEEPAPAETEQAAPPEPAEPEPGPTRRRRRTTPPPLTEPAEAEPEESQPTEVPALEPRESPAQQAALRRQIQQLQESLRQRLRRLDGMRMGSGAVKTRDDAHTFLIHSQEALEKGDLQRALNLAQKAELLVEDLEPQR